MTQATRILNSDHRLEVRQTVAATLPEVFAFFSDAGNLQRLTSPELDFSIVTPLPIKMHVGTLIEYRLKLYGMPFLWKTLISRWEPPHCFVDEQLKGPYRLWVHTHRFTETDEGTEIHDHVRYRLPVWPLGESALPLVKVQLDKIFAYRRQVIDDLFNS